MKAGTTSLHDYLETHPQISMSDPKEINFFSNPKYWRKGTAWYEKHFADDGQVWGESSTSYSCYPLRKDVPERIFDYKPSIKLIYLIRDPMSRFLSHYSHWLSNGLEKRPLSEVIADDKFELTEGYYLQSLYYYQLQRYLKVFPKEQIHIVSSNSLRNSQHETLEQIWKFLGVSSDVPPPPTMTANRSSSKLQRNLWVNITFPKWLQQQSRIPWWVKSPFFRLAQLYAAKIESPKPSDEEIRLIRKKFSSDVKQLAHLLRKDSPEWEGY